MDRDLRMFMVRHGAIVAFLGSLSGFVYTFVLTGGISGSVHSWHLAHLQGVLTGIFIIVASSFITHLKLDMKVRRLIAYLFIITGYCYSIGPVWGAVFGVRGIEPTPPLSNIVMFVSNTIASIAVAVALIITIYGSLKK